MGPHYWLVKLDLVIGTALPVKKYNLALNQADCCQHECDRCEVCDDPGTGAKVVASLQHVPPVGNLRFSNVVVWADKLAIQDVAMC